MIRTKVLTFIMVAYGLQKQTICQGLQSTRHIQICGVRIQQLTGCCSFALLGKPEVRLILLTMYAEI